MVVLTERLDVAGDLADDAERGAVLVQVVQDDCIVVVQHTRVDVLQRLQPLRAQLRLWQWHIGEPLSAGYGRNEVLQSQATGH